MCSITQAFPASSSVQPSSKYHAGNVPTLPQTKYCTLCPAKFTRTTHLNRHLRSHTNERLYHCNTCDSQFTRSDLLARHKRTCGDPNANRSRRKSCQACAASKIKCNLEYPCSKCTSRGRECVFINDPRISRSKKLAASRRASVESAATSEAGSDEYFPYSPHDIPSGSSSPAPSTSSSCSASLDDSMCLHLTLPESAAHSPHSHYALNLSPAGAMGGFANLNMPELSTSPTSTASTPSPLLDPFDAQFEFAQTYGNGAGPSAGAPMDSSALHEQLSRLFPADMFASPFDGAYALQPFRSPEVAAFTPTGLRDDPFATYKTPALDAQAYAAPHAHAHAHAQLAPSVSSSAALADPSNLYQTLAPASAGGDASAPAGTAQAPGWSAYFDQMPVHTPTTEALMWTFT